MSTGDNAGAAGLLRHGMRESDEATGEGLKHSRDEGEAVGRAARHMLEDVAHDGQEKAVADYIVAYAVEEAEGLYHLEDGELRWREPGEENLHLEVSVRDRDDGRLIPGLDVEATLITENGDEVGTHTQPFLWHPFIHHYGRNWKVPGSGRYRLRVRIAPPSFPRHDRTNGKRYAEAVEVEFDDVSVKTGQD